MTFLVSGKLWTPLSYVNKNDIVSAIIGMSTYVNSNTAGLSQLNKLIREQHHKVVCGFFTNCK
jgi:hypothetical protein